MIKVGKPLLLWRRRLLRRRCASTKGIPSSVRLWRRWSRRGKVGKQIDRSCWCLLRRSLTLLGWHLHHGRLLRCGPTRFICRGVPGLVTVFAANPGLEFVLIRIVHGWLHAFPLRVVAGQPNQIHLFIVRGLEAIHFFLCKLGVTDAFDALR